MKISENTSVYEAVKISKETVKVFEKYNLDCPGCRGAKEDTIKTVAFNNGLDLKTFIKELNNSCGSNSRQTKGKKNSLHQ